MALRPSSVPHRVALPSPPASSLPDVPDPKFDLARAASPTVTRLLATVVTNPSFESTVAFALVTELVDFAATHRLDYIASLVTESRSVCPPSVRGDLALGWDVLEDRQFELERLAVVLPSFAPMLLCPKGEPDAPNIPTLSSYVEAITGEYSSQWQTFMDAKMAFWKSTGTYVDEVPPPGANIVGGMWIFRVKRPSGSPPVFKARYVARGFRQRQGVEFFQNFSPTPKMTSLLVLPHVAAQRDYELHSLDFSTAFSQGSLHKEIWLHRPPGFTGSFPEASLTHPAAADSTTRSQWLTRDHAARLAVRNHLPLAERAHFEQHKTAKALYDAVVARYSSPATAALGCLPLPYLFPELSALATVEYFVSLLRTSDARYRAALPADFHDRNPPPMYITLYFIVTHLPNSLRAVRDHFPLAVASGSSSSVGARPLRPSSFTCGKPHSEHRCFSRLDDAWREEFGEEAERPHWAELLRSGVDIFALDYEAILAAMHALCVSAEGDCYLCVPPDPGIEAAALGASESALLGTLPAAALHTFTLDSGHFRCFFRDSTTLTALSAPVPVRLADPSRGPVLASSSTVLPCPARVLICTCHLATFTRRPGSSLYTLTTEPPQVTASAQVSASGPVAPPCSCRLLSHQTLLWHYRLGNHSLPRLRGMHSHLLVSGLPRSQPPLPPCLPCVEGRQRATPHSSFPPTTAPLQTLHMDVWGPARVSGQDRECYFLLVVDDYTCYTTVFPLRNKGEVPDVLIPWICAVRLQLGERFREDLPVLRLHSERGGEFSSDLLWEFCRGEGILQSFTLPASLQQNGIAECRIGLVIEVARTSMIHAAAPHFKWPFAVWYAAHQLNLLPRVSLPKTSPTLRWTGKVGHASVFRVWGNRAFVRDTSANKLSSRTIPCVFLGFPLDPPGWQCYHPNSRRVLPSKKVMFHDMEPGGAEPEGAEPEGAEPGGAEPGGVETGGAESKGAASGGAEPGDAEPGGTETEGVESWGAEPRGTAFAGGAEGSATRGTRPGGAEATSLGGTGATSPGGARTRGTGAAGAGGVGGAGAGGARAGDPGAGGARAGGTLAASPAVSRLLATVVTDTSFESSATSALVAELVDFAAICRLDYATSLVAESEFDCPPSVGGECALGTDVLEDMQEEFQCLAAAVPNLVAMLLAPEGDPDAPDIPTTRSYAEAITSA
ncbi:unnamed protein product [Closterium sp. NIES-54]